MFKLALPVLSILSITLLSSCFTMPTPSQQMIVVTTKDWSAIPARMALYERTSATGKWQPFGQPFRAVVGKKGLGWGRGIFDRKDATNNSFRQEGDKRAPAGVFSLGNTFGVAPEPEAKKELNLKMPYIHLTDSVLCIGDNTSAYYNKIVDTKKINKDWKDETANEKMRYEGLRDEGAYRWGVFIDNNSAKNPSADMRLDKNAGSCIFIHIWKSPDIGTSGCTAIEESKLKTILNWLDPKKAPVIVQLPESEYNRLQKKWNLP